MLNPDFTKYSLALIQSDKIIFSSQRHGLRPLWDCLQNYRQTKERFILHDKVIGLAAARLVVYSGIIAEIQTLLISQPAKKFLDENGIKVEAEKTVANILTQDMRSICHGEIIALNIADPDEFSKKIMSMFEVSKFNYKLDDPEE
jgi:hypothetical protein